MTTDIFHGVTQIDDDGGRRLWADAGVLVTGARGFVGRRLVRHLARQGATVSLIVHHPRGVCENEDLPATGLMTRRLINASVTDFATLAEVIEKRSISTVFHLAAINANRGTKVSPYSLFEANIRGTYTVLEACRVATVAPRVVVLSSREAEQCFDQHRKGETHPYAASKASAELIAASFADTFGLKVVSLRPGNIYGGGDLNWDRLIPSAIRSYLMGQRPVISGALHERRDYIHVDDVVSACLNAATTAGRAFEASGPIRLSTGSHASTVEILQKLANEIGRCDLMPSAVTASIPGLSESHTVLRQPSHALAWSNKTSLDDGLAETVVWYRRYLSRAGLA